MAKRQTKEEQARDKAQPRQDQGAAAKTIKHQGAPEQEKEPEMDLAGQYKEMAQRVQAEFDNFRKRNTNARQEAREDGVMSAVTAILPVLDSMEQAEKLYQKQEQAEMAEGFNKVMKQFLDQLHSLGVTRMPVLGQMFDPNLHEAMMQAKAEGKKSGEIIEVFRNGYQLKEKVIRPAQVIVAE